MATSVPIDYSPFEARNEWIIGVLFQICGSLFTNLGINVQKLSHSRSQKNQQLQQQQQQQIIEKSQYNLDTTNHHEHVTNDDPQQTAIPYFKRPLWILGFLLFCFGELLSGIAMGHASQSLLAVISSYVLILNGIFSYILMNDRLTLGYFKYSALIMCGSIIVILSTHHSPQQYTLTDLGYLFSSLPFLIFFSIVIAMIFYLYFLQRSIPQNAKVLAVLASLMASLAVLFAKCSIQLIKTTLLEDNNNQLVYTWTWVIFATFILFASQNVHFLNLSLQLEKTTTIYPLYFTSSTLFVIFFGIVFFQEYSVFTLSQAIGFMIGLCITLWGIFLLSRHNKQQECVDQGISSRSPMHGSPRQDRDGYGITNHNELTPLLSHGHHPHPHPHPHPYDGNEQNPLNYHHHRDGVGDVIRRYTQGFLRSLKDIIGDLDKYKDHNPPPPHPISSVMSPQDNIGDDHDCDHDHDHHHCDSTSDRPPLTLPVVGRDLGNHHHHGRPARKGAGGGFNRMDGSNPHHPIEVHLASSEYHHHHHHHHKQQQGIPGHKTRQSFHKYSSYGNGNGDDGVDVGHINPHHGSSPPQAACLHMHPAGILTGHDDSCNTGIFRTDMHNTPNHQGTPLDPAYHLQIYPSNPRQGQGGDKRNNDTQRPNETIDEKQHSPELASPPNRQHNSNHIIHKDNNNNNHHNHHNHHGQQDVCIGDDSPNLVCTTPHLATSITLPSCETCSIRDEDLIPAQCQYHQHSCDHSPTHHQHRHHRHHHHHHHGDDNVSCDTTDSNECDHDEAHHHRHNNSNPISHPHTAVEHDKVHVSYFHKHKCLPNKIDHQIKPLAGTTSTQSMSLEDIYDINLTLPLTMINKSATTPTNVNDPITTHHTANIDEHPVNMIKQPIIKSTTSLIDVCHSCYNQK